ncbi:MAG: hypothetical protein Q9186_006608 [Xanthomendoza sp. 1 TL-2023]
MSQQPHGPPAGTSTGAVGAGPPKALIGHPAAYYHELGGIIIGVPCMLLVLCISSVVGRMMARRMTKVPLGADDFTAIFALMQLASQLVYAILMGAARASILLVYQRIFSLQIRWFRIAWWTTMAIVLAYSLVLLIVFLTQCSPHAINTLWLDPATCRQAAGYSTVRGPTIGGFINAAVDILVLLLPTRMVWTLQMQTKRKILVCILFAFGLLGVAVSLARAIALLQTDTKPGSGSVAIACWSTAEAAVALLCANLPMQRPLFSRAYDKVITSRGTSNTESYPLSPRLGRKDGDTDDDKLDRNLYCELKGR